jgi:hypothetical protein
MTKGACGTSIVVNVIGFRAPHLHITVALMTTRAGRALVAVDELIESARRLENAVALITCGAGATFIAVDVPCEGAPHFGITVACEAKGATGTFIVQHVLVVVAWQHVMAIAFVGA